MGKEIKKQDSKSTGINSKKLLKQQKIATFFTKTTAIVFLLIMSIIVIIPFYWMLNTSFKTAEEQEKTTPTLYPHEWTFENYKVAFLGKKQVTINNYEKAIKDNPALIEKIEKELQKDKPLYDRTLEEIRDIDNSSDLTLKFTPGYLDIYKQLLPYIQKDAERKTLSSESANKRSLIIDIDAAIEKAKNENNTELVNQKTEEKKQLEEQIKQLEIKIKAIEEDLKSEQYKNLKDSEAAYLANNNNVKYAKNYQDKLDVKLEYEKKIVNKQQLNNDYYKAKNNIEHVKSNQDDSFKIYIFHTLVVGISSTILGTFMSIIGAFALSRLSFKGKNFIFSVMLATMMIPGEMMVISNFITVSKLNWTDDIPNNQLSYLAMIVPFLVTVFHIYLLRQTFKTIPDELYYAAKVDGTSDFKYLWKVMVPLAKSSIITIVILKLMGTWNAYIWPNLVAKNHKLITVWLRTSFNDTETGRVALELQMAATVLVLLPLLFVFIFLRKYIMRGVSRGGTKG